MKQPGVSEVADPLPMSSHQKSESSFEKELLRSWQHVGGLACGFFKVWLGDSLPLGKFVTSTLGGKTPVKEPSDLFPCPPPYPWAFGEVNGGPRQRRRFRCKRQAELMVNIMTVTLSHVALHCCTSCPPGGRAGAPLSDQQRELVKFLHKVCQSMQRLVVSSSDPINGKLGTLQQSLWTLHSN